jgi:DNA-directed RNA polymerase subunit RPC12/RpoP
MRYIKTTLTILNITRIWEERSASAPYTKQWKLLLDIGENETMSYGKCWTCGAVMSGDSQTMESKVKCDRCGWVSGKDGSY